MTDIKLPELPAPYYDDEHCAEGFTANQMRDYALSAVRENVPEGYKLVTIEPTEEMIDAMLYATEYGDITVGQTKELWAAALNAVPDSEGGK